MAKKHSHSFSYSNVSIFALGAILVAIGLFIISANSMIAAEIEDDTPTPMTPNETNSSPLAEDNDFVSTKLIVYTNDSYALQDVNANITPLINSFYILEFDTIDAAKNAYRDLRNNPAIIDVVADATLTPSSVPANREAYGVSGIGASDYKEWLSLISNTTEIRVAVVDSGITASHEVFNNPNRIVTTQSTRNYAANNTDLTDENTGGGHGTAVAGIIAESTPSNVKIYPYKVFGSDGRLDISGNILTSSVFLAISAAAQQDRANIINLSLGLTETNGEPVSCSETALYDAFFSSLKSNYKTLVVAAAGNSRHNGADFPANCNNVVGVSSVNQHNEFSLSFSSYGNGVDFAMPGEDLLLPINEGSTSYGYGSGTSFSAPFLSAAAALLMSEYPNDTPDQIIAKLKQYTVSTNNRTYFGNGIVNFSDTYLASPRVILSQTATNWVEQDTITIKAFSSKKLAFKKSTLNEAPTDSDWTTITTPLKSETSTRSVTKNGTYYFAYKSGAGEMNQSSIEIKNIDRMPPRLENGTQTAINVGPNSAKLKATIKDDDSGIKKIVFHIKKATAPTYTKQNELSYGDNEDTKVVNASLNVDNLDSNTDYSYYISAIDRSGHDSSTPERVFRTLAAGATPNNDEPDDGQNTDTDEQGTDVSQNTNSASDDQATNIEPEAVKTSNASAPKTLDNITASAIILPASSVAAIIIYYIASRRRR